MRTSYQLKKIQREGALKKGNKTITRNYFHALLVRFFGVQNFFRLFPLQSGGFEVNLPPVCLANSEPFESGTKVIAGTLSSMPG